MVDPLEVRDLDEAAEAISEIGQDEIRLFERVVADAVRGKALAVSAYLKGWKSLENRLFRLARDRVPDVVAESEGQYLVGVEGGASARSEGLLDLAAVGAPFSPMVARFGVGKGVALHLLVEFRRSVPKIDPLVTDRVVALPSWDISRHEFAAFVRRVWLAEVEEQPPLERIIQVFDLTDTELASWFGVRRQAIAPWRAGDVPADRAARIQTIAAIADVLERNLNTHAIPGVLRKPADVYDGRSIMQMIRDERENEVLQQLRRTFDWAASA